MSSVWTHRVETTKTTCCNRVPRLISISAQQESFFAKKFSITEWNRPEEELSSPPAKRQPLRALVKDLVDTDPEITQKLIASILRELKALNSLRIYVMDVKWSNYKGGHLADFSSAWTAPHLSSWDTRLLTAGPSVTRASPRSKNRNWPLSVLTDSRCSGTYNFQRVELPVNPYSEDITMASIRQLSLVVRSTK
ncbi:hypothetical protein LTR96_011808 [Exophiala xenobiotica]|nr:hypothetical protein LTR96_011808 [Exophiala xenobiotica]